MFSENSKISGRQIKRVVVLDWVGKTVLLLPRFTGGASGRSFILSLVMAICLTFLYAGMIGWLERHIDQDFYAYIQERLGTLAAWFISVVCICYVFVNAVYMVRLFAVIAALFLLPESAQLPLMIMILIGSMCIAGGGIETGSRVAELLYRVILLPLAFMLLCAVFSIHPEYLLEQGTDYTQETVKHGLQMFICFGGMGMVLFVTPNLNEVGSLWKMLRNAIAVVGGGTIALFLVAIGMFGPAGMRAQAWPAIALMSSVEIPGGFLQRWDIVFTVLLLASFFISVGIALFYMNMLTERILQKKRKAYLPIFSVLVFAVALWCGNYETAVHTYIIINGYLLVPVIVVFILFLAMLEYIKRRRRG